MNLSGSHFLPQGISFSAQTQSNTPTQPEISFGPEHAALKSQIETLSDSQAKNQLQAELIVLESQFRSSWLKLQISTVEKALHALIEAAENPAKWRGETCQNCQTALIATLDQLRQALPNEYQQLLQHDSLLPIQRFISAQLTKLDALGLNNASAWEKSREQAQSFKTQLVESEVLPAELYALVDLDRLLDTAIRYQFAWDVARRAKGQLTQHLTALQQIAIRGLKAPRAPEPRALPGPIWSWRNGALRNELGVPVHSLRRSAQEWLNLGFRGLKIARRQQFKQIKVIQEALECFYAAHSLAPDQAEPLVALATLFTLLNRPHQAVDCLELALKRKALPEIKELFWQIQELEELLAPNT